jgi:hypothetical protein
MMFIVGVPNWPEMDECTPSKFTIALVASVLTTLRVEPKLYNKSEGGWVRNAKKAIGNKACRRVPRLNKTSVRPAVRTGRVRMWYSSGVKVYEPYQ